MASEIFCDECGAPGMLAGGVATLTCGHQKRFYAPLDGKPPRFPPLYECSECGLAVKVIPQGEGVEPLKLFECDHTTAPIWANRKVTLRGKGSLDAMHPLQRGVIRFTLTLRQFLSALTGRSI